MWTERQLESALDRMAREAHSGERWEWALLDNDDLELLVTAFQSRKRRYGDRKAALVGRASAVLADIVSGYGSWHARKRIQARAPRLLDQGQEDVQSAATLFCLEQLDGYQVNGQGTVLGYLSSRIEWFVADYVRDNSLSGTLDRSWHLVRSAAGVVRQEWEAREGKSPSEGELASAVREHMTRVEADKVAAANPRWGEARCRQEAEARLVKQGVRKALEDLASIRLLTHEVYLDTPVREDGHTLAETLVDQGGGSSEQRLDLLFALALGADGWARPALAARFGAQDDVEGEAALGWERSAGKKVGSLTRLASACGKDKAELRSVLDRAVSRLSSPHAHWCYLRPEGSRELMDKPRDLVGGLPRELFADV